MAAEATYFTNGEGVRLAALLNRPAGKPKAYALFAHCFTCGKDIPAARIIAERLVAHGIAVLRFDFSGLGGSEGDFANTNFSSQIDDLVAATDYLRETAEAPKLLIGHSLGGSAVLACASRIDEVLAVATIGAPCDPSHVANLFAEQVKEIEKKGEVSVKLAGREFKIRQKFLDDISEQKMTPLIGNLKKALLVMHAPGDEIVGVENASHIFGHAKHPKSFISLDGANHLLRRKRDAGFAADMLAIWALRYLVGQEPGVADERALVMETRVGRFQQSIALGHHHLLADEPVSFGGLDSGPSPYEFLLAGLGACTSMTLRLYAERKSIPLERASVALSHSRHHGADSDTACDGKPAALERIDREITLEGELSPEQRARLLEIADKCPVHRTLTSQLDICTKEIAT
jgi:uncharacterized OsmC-like protein/alpha/beta superfamily hydrolase